MRNFDDKSLESERITMDDEVLFANILNLLKETLVVHCNLSNLKD